MADALNMGGYAAYVWPCYIVTVIVLAGLAVFARRAVKRQEEALADLDQDTTDMPREPAVKEAGE
jgi:heme exporter protein D